MLAVSALPTTIIAAPALPLPPIAPVNVIAPAPAEPMVKLPKAPFVPVPIAPVIVAVPEVVCNGQCTSSSGSVLSIYS